MAVYGACDRNVVPEDNIPLLRQALAGSPDGDVEIYACQESVTVCGWLAKRVAWDGPIVPRVLSQICGRISSSGRQRSFELIAISSLRRIWPIDHSAMDSRNSSELDRLEGEILDSLAELNRNLESVLDGSYVVNPAELHFDLELRSDHLRQLLASMDEELSGLAEAAGCDLNELAREILADAVAGAHHPLVVTSSWGGSLPKIDVSSRLLGAAVTRLCELAANYAGSGGELSLRTMRQHDGAELIIEARPIEPLAGEERGSDVVLRCRSIELFIKELGGHFCAEQAEEGVMSLHLQLAGAKHLS